MGAPVFAGHMVQYYLGIHGHIFVASPIVVDSVLGIDGVGCVWQDLDCRWEGL